MQTMTTEQKAKAYDRALKVLHKYDGANIMFTQDLKEEMFPELAESEDERIRKEIIEFLREAYSTGNAPEECGKWIVFLEKQKEQKPVHTAKEMWKEMRLEVYAQASGNRHEPNYSDDSTKMFSLCDIDEIFEKIGNSTVGSQPAEWSEEDESNLQSCIAKLEIDMQHWGKHGKTMVDGDIKLINWLKSLPERFNLQLKQEWSEEDEKLLDFWLDVIDRNDWRMDENFCKASREFINRLKSLRPQSQWKPSEEQMYILNWVANILLSHDGIVERKAAQELQSLHNDLRKL